MTVIYLLVALVIHFAHTSPQLIEGVNTIFNSNLSGVSIFWYGLLIVVILDLLT